MFTVTINSTLKNKNTKQNILINWESEMTVINKINLHSSSETVSMFHSSFSPFWYFNKMHQDSEVTFNQRFKSLMRLNIEFQYKLLFIYHTKKVKNPGLLSYCALQRQHHSSCSWHPTAVARSFITTASQNFTLFLGTAHCMKKQVINLEFI